MRNERRGGKEGDWEADDEVMMLTSHPNTHDNEPVLPLLFG